MTSRIPREAVLKLAMYLLDTNHASRIMDGRDSTLIEHLKSVEPELLSVCPIVSGELSFMVERSTKRDQNRRHLLRVLDLLVMHDVTDDIAMEYGALKAALIAHFGPSGKRTKTQATLRDIGVSDNDLWIAAVARHHGLILVTQDADFERIAEVAELQRECWLGV